MELDRPSPNHQEKPWSQEYCREIYVRGDIGQRELVMRSGRGSQTLTNWSKQDEASGRGSWVEQRKQYKSKVRAKTDEKTIEKVSEALSDRWVELAQLHFDCYEIYREISVIVGLAVLDRVRALSDDRADAEQILMTANPAQLNVLISVLDRAVNGQRKAASMDHLDLNRAIECVVRAGYDLIPSYGGIDIVNN